jgi:hypothetical protein
MAANSMVDGEAIATRRGPHPLALAYFGVFVLVILVFGTVAYFGRASDGDPVVTLELHGTVPRPANKSAHASVPSALSPKPSGAPSAALAPAGAPVSPGSTAPFADTAPPSLPPQIVPTTIIKPVVAGNALIADPALIEQTQQGPLPRIADDGRTPMTRLCPVRAVGQTPPYCHCHQRAWHQRESNVRRHRRTAARSDSGLRALRR